MWKSVGMLILNIWKTKKCSKPPTSSWPQASSDHQFIASSLDHKKAAWSKGWSEIPPSHHGFQYFSLLKWSNDLDDLGYPYDLGKQRKPYLKHENIFFENVWDIKKTDQSKAHQVKKGWNFGPKHDPLRWSSEWRAVLKGLPGTAERSPIHRVRRPSDVSKGVLNQSFWKNEDNCRT